MGLLDAGDMRLDDGQRAGVAAGNAARKLRRALFAGIAWLQGTSAIGQ